MAKKASIEKLNSLHDLIATYYKETINDAVTDGEQLSSGTLAAINAFLKNNSITADVAESEPMQDLQARIKEMIKKEEA